MVVKRLCPDRFDPRGGLPHMSRRIGLEALDEAGQVVQLAECKQDMAVIRHQNPGEQLRR